MIKTIQLIYVQGSSICRKKLLGKFRVSSMKPNFNKNNVNWIHVLFRITEKHKNTIVSFTTFCPVETYLKTNKKNLCYCKKNQERRTLI